MKFYWFFCKNNSCKYSNLVGSSNLFKVTELVGGSGNKAEVLEPEHQKLIDYKAHDSLSEILGTRCISENHLWTTQWV